MLFLDTPLRVHTTTCVNALRHAATSRAVTRPDVRQQHAMARRVMARAVEL
jgi:hypothetical protein